MGLAYETALDLFRAGNLMEVLRRCGRTAEDAASLPRPEHRLLLARCLLYTGAVDVARSIANANRNISPQIQSRCEVILGLASKRQGDFKSAIQHLQHAV